ncbi:MAG: PepSY-like domain-containing protein [Muribaculaceae bacterium]|nr:PepSY-like domain-containing protein [Muribaculaceae bacterium]
MKKILLLLLMAAPLAVFAQASVDSMSMRTAMTDWIDPVRATPVNTAYVLYPTPSRGDATEGSCLVYLPDGYDDSGDKRYPVIYYLHGGTGNQREAAWLINEVHRAIADNAMDPVIVVSPQALPIGWYVNANESDSKVTSGPIADVIIKDLIPFVDSRYRTVADASGRGIEGFSMGGRGALALAFSHPDMFGAVSSVAGAVVDWDEEPLQRALECTFGDVDDPFSRIYFDAWHPRTAACRNAREIKANGMSVRMWVGDRDRLYNENGNMITEKFHRLLQRLGIAHTLTIVPGASHNPAEIFSPSVNPYDVSFWQKAFSASKQAPDAPAGISGFVSTHFPGVSIVALVTSREENGDHYLVTLSDGISLKFNEHFNWIRVEAGAQGAQIPDSMVHNGILAYLATNDINAAIVRIEKVPRVGYDVLLSDGEALLFDTNGTIAD